MNTKISAQFRRCANDTTGTANHYGDQLAILQNVFLNRSKHSFLIQTCFFLKIGAFHLPRTHLGGGGGVSYTFPLHITYMQKGGGRGPDSM